MRRRRRRVVRPVRKNCLFCQEGAEPNWKKPEVLAKFASERGRILSKARTGVCAKHQRRLTREIKRARFMALLPFVVKIK